MTGQQVDVLSALADPLPCACIWLLAGDLSMYCPPMMTPVLPTDTLSC